MCDGPSPSQPYRPTWQDVLIALSLNQIGRAQAVKEKKEQQHIIIYRG